MRELKNKEGKRFLIFYFIIIAIACLVTGLVLKGQEQKSQAIVNETIAKIISKIQESYPEVKEEELIQILNETGNVEQGKEILRRYGIEDVSSIQKLEDLERERRIYLISIVGILGITCLIVFFFYLKYTIIVKLCQHNVCVVCSSNFNNVILNKRIEIIFLF